MKPSPFRYHRADSLDQALELVSIVEDAEIIAGGQSLMPMLNLRLASPASLIDINCVQDLSFIRLQEGLIAIGSITRHRTVENSDLVQQHLPLLSNAVGYIGHPQIRSRGTFGGSLCHLDPAAQIPLVAMTYDATLTVGRRNEVRKINFRDFPMGLMTTALEEDEMLLETRFEPWPAESGWGYAQFARRKGDFSIVSAAVLLRADLDRRVTQAAVCLGGVQEAPVRLGDLEKSLLGRQAGDDSSDATREACDALEMLDDPVVPRWYRAKIAPVMVRRAIIQAGSRIKAS